MLAPTTRRRSDELEGSMAEFVGLIALGFLALGLGVLAAGYLLAGVGWLLVCAIQRSGLVRLRTRAGGRRPGGVRALD
jgi:dolichol kinase